MELQTRSPAALVCPRRPRSVPAEPWLTLALQVLLDEGAVLPGCLVEGRALDASVPPALPHDGARPLQVVRQQAPPSVAARTARAGRGRAGWLLRREQRRVEW
jgi:hypothetical protein